MYGLNASQDLGDVTLGASWDTIDPIHGKDESFEFEAFKIEPVYTTDSFFTASANWDKNRRVGLGLNFIELLRGDSNNTNVFAKKPGNRRGGKGLWSFRLYQLHDTPLDQVPVTYFYRHRRGQGFLYRFVVQGRPAVGPQKNILQQRYISELVDA